MNIHDILHIKHGICKVICQPSSSQKLATLLQAKLEILEGGGHALRMQAPDWHNAVLLEHIEEAIGRDTAANEATEKKSYLPTPVSATYEEEDLKF